MVYIPHVDRPATEARINAQMAALARSGGVPFNSVLVVSIGPGRVGKTCTRRALQGLTFEHTPSTVGGDEQTLTIRLRNGAMLGFTELEQRLTHAQRIVLRGLLQEAAQTQDMSAVETFVNDLATTQGEQSTDGEEAPFDAAPSTASSTASTDAAADEPADGAAATATTTSDAASAASPAATPPQVQLPQRDRDALLDVYEAQLRSGNSHGVHVTFYDMGGQPEFWPLVGEFLRK